LITVYLKAVHIAALIVWCGGLLVIPALFAKRGKADTDPELWHLQGFTRFLYVGITSPAAFIAVASGTGLIFAREVFTAWFAMKLLAVGALVIVHVRIGFVVLKVFDEGKTYSLLRCMTATGIAATVMSTILWLVLMKPAIEIGPLPEWATTPGGLQSLSETMIPIP
jgi:protoporphyrinogen IX oxidase